MSLSWMEDHQASNADTCLESETIHRLASLIGFSLSPKKQLKLQGFVRRRMASLGLSCEADYCDRLQPNAPRHSPHATEWAQLIDEVTNGESYFFRDRGQLALIREVILPELIAHRRRLVREGLSRHLYLNLWSAGCSTGEEPYSLAMILKDALIDFADWQINLIATDINPVAIAQAKAGLYRDWSLRQLDPMLRRRFFKSLNQGWQIAPELQSMIQWDLINLNDPKAIAHRIPHASMDIIICRNVFIYFKPTAIAKVMRQFQASLSADGSLFVGHTELEGQDLSFLSSRHERGAVIYQRMAPRPGSSMKVPSSTPPPVKPDSRLPVVEKEPNPPPDSICPPESICSSQVQWILAMEAFEHEQWDNVQIHAERVVAQNTQHIDARLMLVEVATLQGDWPQALSLIRNIFCLNPHHLIAHLKLVNLYALMGKPIKRQKTLLTLERLVAGLPPTQKIDDRHHRTIGELQTHLTWLKSKS